MAIKLQKNLFEGDGPLTQVFGANPDAYAQFGMKGHNGIDYGIPTGTTLYSAIDGKVIEVAYDATGYGKYIKIENDICGVLYGHMKTLSGLSIGSSVKAGDGLGPSGNTGNSTGPHLHFGVFSKPRNRDNGYAGYIDPLGPEIEWVDNYNGDCESKLDDMRESRDRWKADYKDLEEKYVKEIQEKNKEIDRLQEDITAKKTTITELIGEVADATSEHDTLLRDKERLEGQLEASEDEVDEQSIEIDELETKLQLCKDGNSLFAYSWDERLLSLFVRKPKEKEGVLENDTDK